MEMYDLVEVEWLDAQSGFHSPITIEELESEKPAHTKSIGYLVKEDKEKVILGFMLFGDEGMFKHWQLIPQGMIKKITKLIRNGDRLSPVKQFKEKIFHLDKNGKYACNQKLFPENKTKERENVTCKTCLRLNPDQKEIKKEKLEAAKRVLRDDY